MKKRFYFIGTLLVIIFSLILSLFWYQESRYLLPTPVPAGYHPVAVGGQPAVSQNIRPFLQEGKPVLLHFFNPECPCSRFNMDHFIGLVKTYRPEFTFVAVLQAGDDRQAVQNFEKKYNLGIPVIVDTDKRVAKACGVYATPQAVILNKNGRIYYRGNYNKSRYCTKKNSNFAQMAIDSLLAGNQPPVFVEIATQAYGCELPDSIRQTSIFHLFN